MLRIAKLERLCYCETRHGSLFQRVGALEADIFGSERSGPLDIRLADLDASLETETAERTPTLKAKAHERRACAPEYVTDMSHTRGGITPAEAWQQRQTRRKKIKDSVKDMSHTRGALN